MYDLSSIAPQGVERLHLAGMLQSFSEEPTQNGIVLDLDFGHWCVIGTIEPKRGRTLSEELELWLPHVARFAEAHPDREGEIDILNILQWAMAETN